MRRIRARVSRQGRRHPRLTWARANVGRTAAYKLESSDKSSCSKNDFASEFIANGWREGGGMKNSLQAFGTVDDARRTGIGVLSLSSSIWTLSARFVVIYTRPGTI